MFGIVGLVRQLETLWQNINKKTHNMKTLNTTTFRNLTLTLGLLVLGFISKAQTNPYSTNIFATATSFVDGNSAANPNTGTDLWYDFGWERSATKVDFQNINNSNRIRLDGNGNSGTITVTTIDFSLTNSNSLNVTYQLTGGSVTTSQVTIVNTSNNNQLTTINLLSTTVTTTNILANINNLTPGNYILVFELMAPGSRGLTISGFSTNATPSLLPVSYASLSAKPLVNAVKIEWATTNEVNNSHFEVERTNDGENWSNIGTVEGNGNTFSITNYEFVDNSPAQGVNIYRLKQVDWNGDFEYSITKTVLWGGESSKNSVQIFPNPSASTIQVSGVENPKVTVYNMAGVVMLQSENTNRMDLQELLKGVYFIHVQDAAGEVSRIRFIKE